MTTAADDFVLPEADRSLVWVRDALHCPRPLTPLGSDSYSRFVNIMPMPATATEVNGYMYLGLGGTSTAAVPPLFAPPPPGLNPTEAWENHHLPLVRELCDGLWRADYSSLSSAELAAGMPGWLDQSCSALRQTMFAVDGLEGPATTLATFVSEKLGRDGLLLAMTMIQGAENEMSATGGAVADLAVLAAATPAVATALTDGRFENLESIPASRPFLQAFEAFIEENGRSAQLWGEIHVPTWAEDRAAPLRMVAAYLANQGRQGEAVVRTAKSRETAIAEVERSLSVADCEQLHELIAAAAHYVPVIESRARWQLNAVGALRRPTVALGDALVREGRIDARDDVFFLHIAEMYAAADGSLNVRPLVAARRADFERWQTLDAPQTLGAPVPIEAILQIPMMGQFFGLRAPVKSAAGVVTGHPASRGVVRGRARVILSLDEADGLEPGDILVCPSTAPPWTPYFAIVAAVVTNGGGVLCHAAIEAREYGIPAVVGTGDGTKRIPDGATVTVDGEAGTITIEP
jgi:pyruvate,water dikinase